MYHTFGMKTMSLNALFITVSRVTFWGSLASMQSLVLFTLTLPLFAKFFHRPSNYKWKTALLFLYCFFTESQISSLYLLFHVKKEKMSIWQSFIGINAGNDREPHTRQLRPFLCFSCFCKQLPFMKSKPFKSCHLHITLSCGVEDTLLLHMEGH